LSDLIEVPALGLRVVCLASNLWGDRLTRHQTNLKHLLPNQSHHLGQLQEVLLLAKQCEFGQVQRL